METHAQKFDQTRRKSNESSIGGIQKRVKALCAEPEIHLADVSAPVFLFWISAVIRI